MVSRMDLVELTKALVINLISDKENLKINLIEEEKTTIIQILVSNEDMASVIGRGGSIANAIRTIVQAAAYTNKLGSVRVNIDAL